MPDYYQNVSLNLKDVDDLDFGFYYDSKHHRYVISINCGAEYINVTRKEGETILAFLRIMKEFLESRRKLRTPGSTADSNESSTSRDSQEVEESFEFSEEDPDGYESKEFSTSKERISSLYPRHCGCRKPEPVEEIQEPYHTQTSRCKNCGHLIYFQFRRWEHYTRAYKPYGYPYTTPECYAKAEEADA